MLTVPLVRLIRRKMQKARAGEMRMLIWIKANIATLVICVILAAVLTAAVRKLVQYRKKRRSGCGSGCAGCAMADKCRSNGNDRERDGQ